MVKKISIPYFPGGLKYCTPILFGLAIYLGTIGFIFWSAVLVILGVIILTTKYVTEIDLKEKRIRDFLFFLGLKLNAESQRFEKLESIIVTKGSYSQTVNTRVQSRQMDWSDYTGTLVFDDDKTLDLLTRSDKKELLTGLKTFVDFLKVGVEDRTTSEHRWIDITNI